MSADLTIMGNLNVQGSADFDGRVQFSKGSDVASANDLTLPSNGNSFDVTGITPINGIATSGWQAGTWVLLKFENTLTVKHNTAASAGFASIWLAAGADFSATADDVLPLYYDGALWREESRTVA
jgi:hypothetical protein